ncbi:G-protein coupled receptor 1-like isoform X2 [Haliotis rufescens]|uniref:G-protein coupled receptor 1-like isoform X2 n=1 Tax=Haliotis rufescens TaxID=6454 RepID=UPI00201F84C0|nr:G-protein coupled receptor 1-like isoform X2 [Haliotis rufescens]
MASRELLASEMNASSLSLNRCPMFPDNPDHCDTVVLVRKVVASFSFIGCVFMIFVIWLFKKYIVFTQRLILYLSISALLDSISYLMSDMIPDSKLCNFLGWWLTFFDWTVLLWVGCITFNLYMNVIRATTTHRFEWAYHILCWVFSFVVSCLPFINDRYGPAGAWCWIIEDWKWRLGIWYGPLFIIIALLFVAYIYISVMLHRKANTWEGTYDPDTEREHQMLKEDIKPLRFYPFVYLAVSIFPLINRIQNAISPHYHVFALVLLASISAPLHGALNAIVFGMDKETLHKLKPAQIRVAFQSHLHHQEVREYPVAYRSPETPPSHSVESQAPRFQHISYSKLH